MSDEALSPSFLASSRNGENPFQTYDSSFNWLMDCQEDPRYSVNQVAFSELNGWSIDAATGTVKHTSGKFFTIEGLDCQSAHNGVHWQQPIIHQREVGLLGIITKVFDGQRFFLMQAKMEPGNVNRVQLSPTLQATYSNYTQVHKGNLPPYLEYFLDRENAITINDQLQSETGTRFFQKFNRNILLDVQVDVELRDEYRWFTLREIHELMANDDMVNMDARSVLSNIDYGDEVDRSGNHFLTSATSPSGFHQQEVLSSWLSEMRSKYPVRTKDVSLNQIKDWEQNEWGFSNSKKNYFSVVAVDVEAREREVPHWNQPILKHEGIGLAGFLCKKFDGILHFLIQAKPEPGIVESVELGPTVSVFDYENRKDEVNSIPYFDSFLSSEGAELYSVVHSEEGGRFWNLRNRFLVKEVDENTSIEEEERYRWMTLRQLYLFSQVDSRVNSETRTLLACLGNS